jgi:ketosteroid isomerase-like protein
MRTQFALTTVCVLLLCGVLLHAGSEQANDANAVNAAFDRYVLGWQKGDLNLLGGVYAHDARLTAYWPDPTRPSRLESWATVRESLQDIFSRIDGMDLEFKERQIDVYGTFAVLTSQWTWHDPADPMFGHGRATFVFKKEAGDWRIVHEHSSVMPFVPGEEPGQPGNEGSH